MPSTNGTNEHAGAVIRVVDGDSLYLEGVTAQIRLWGVDAPERDGLAMMTHEVISRNSLWVARLLASRWTKIIMKGLLPVVSAKIKKKSTGSC